jgi:hypothetical protein
MGEEGASWVQGRFSQERLADDLTRLYGELLARARPRLTQVALSPSVAAG